MSLMMFNSLFYFKMWFVHLKVCMMWFKLNIQISICLVILNITTSFQEVSNHLVLSNIKPCIQFQAFIGHSTSNFWKLHVCHKLSNNQFTLFNCMLLNSFLWLQKLACSSNKIQVILLCQIFIFFRWFAFLFIVQNHLLNKDDSILNLLNSKLVSKLCHCLCLTDLFINMIWIVQVLNNSLWLILIKLFLFADFLFRFLFSFFFNFLFFCWSFFSIFFN